MITSTRIWRILPVAGVFVAAMFTAKAAQATPIAEYTFDSLAIGQVTPLLNVAPDVNPGTFLTSFTDTNPTGSFVVEGSLQPALFAGNYVIELHGQTDGLILTFNTPVYQLDVTFGLSVAAADPKGSLRITTPTSGTASQTAANNGSMFQTGVLTFGSSTPFTSATLQGLISDGVTPIGLAIDNLEVNPNPIPEPASVTLLCSGLGAAFIRYRRRSSLSR
jgi:hypothetical protein